MFITIDPPPGIVRTGTAYKTKGRFYSSNLWRWFAGAQEPIGGWVPHSTSAVSGKARTIITWRDNAGAVWAGIGTHTGLYTMTRSGVLSDITPLGFTPGRADATTGGGYGAGTYGSGIYGTPRTSPYSVIDASVWSLDTWGEDLVGLMSDDGFVYQWSPLASDASLESTGTAQAGSATTITLAAGASVSDNAYNKYYVIITGGTGTVDEARLVLSYVGSTKIASVNTAWSVTPDATTTYAIKRTGRVANAPTGQAIVVTSEKSLMVLGADGDPRAIANSDLEDDTDWTETVLNYARHAVLQTQGKIVCGKRINGGTLIFTDVDVWLATFQGQPFVYGYERAGTNCGVISQQAVCVTSSLTFWMSKNGFWVYNGYSEPLPCDVHDYIFSDINLVQASKVYAVHNSAFGEVWWFYCSSQSTEIDRYVVYNYRESHWTIGLLIRLSGVDRGVFTLPMMLGNDGYVYDHETGLLHDGVGPSATTGPFEMGPSGDNLYMVNQIVPDVGQLDGVTVSFYVQMYPMRDGINYGPYTLSDLTDARFTGRQTEITYSAPDGVDFRIGAFRFDVVARGKR